MEGFELSSAIATKILGWKVGPGQTWLQEDGRNTGYFVARSSRDRVYNGAFRPDLTEKHLYPAQIKLQQKFNSRISHYHSRRERGRYTCWYVVDSAKRIEVEDQLKRGYESHIHHITAYCVLLTWEYLNATSQQTNKSPSSDGPKTEDGINSLIPSLQSGSKAP